MSKPKRTKPDKKQAALKRLKALRRQAVECHDMRIPTKKKNRDVEIRRLEDQIDVEDSVKILDDLRKHPEKIIRGAVLAKRMKRWA